jgi:hypothetical protein
MFGALCAMNGTQTTAIVKCPRTENFNMLSNNRSLIEQIDQCIEVGCSTWNDVDELNQELLAAEAMRGLGDEAYVCITESDEIHEILKDLRKHLLTGNNMHDLAQSMTHAVVQYFAPELSKLFLERLEVVSDDFWYERGYVPTIDNQTGEREWVRA